MRGKSEGRRPKVEGRPKSDFLECGRSLPVGKTAGISKRQRTGAVQNLAEFRTARTAWLSIFLCFQVTARLLGATNLVSADDIPPLRPPRGELAPTYWEQHGAWPVVFGVVGVLVLGAILWLLLRPRPPAPVPPVVAAHQALDPLANQPENGVVLSRISQVVRRYFCAAFGLPPGELTTAEFSRELEERHQVGAALSTAVNAFLRECDRRKFAPGPPPAPLGAAGLAARLIDQAEARRTAAAEHAIVLQKE